AGAASGPRETCGSTSPPGRRWSRSARRRSQTRECRSASRGSSRGAELVVALDLASGREALALAARLPGLRWVKIGPVLYVREGGGPALVRELAARGVRVFLDLKWHDIPSVVAGAVEAARELGVGMATVHTLGGPAMLAAAGAAAGDVALLGVTVLTSHDAGDFERVVGRGVPDLGFEAERLARLALDAGLAGVVASGHELGLLREALGPGPLIVVPGIRAAGPARGARREGRGPGPRIVGPGTRAPGDAAEDQARTSAAAAAVRRGATHLGVGRPITRAADPAGVYQRLVDSV